MKKYIDIIYWSRYDQDSSYKWIHIKSFSYNQIARRGQWISGKHAYGDFKSSPVIIKHIRHIRRPDITLPKDADVHDFLERCAKKYWTPFYRTKQIKQDFNKWKNKVYIS